MGFAKPTEETWAATEEPGWVSEDQPALGLDANDEVLEGFNEDADAYAGLRECEPGTYLGKVMLSQNHPGIGSYKNKEGKEIYYLQTSFQVTDPTSGMVNRMVFGMINTRPIRTDTGVTTAVSSLLKKLGQRATGKQSVDVQALRQLLLTEPAVKAEVDWEFRPEPEYAKDDDGKYIRYPRSWKKFPKTPEGKPLMIEKFNVATGQADEEGAPGKTQAYVRRYLAVK